MKMSMSPLYLSPISPGDRWPEQQNEIYFGEKWETSSVKNSLKSAKKKPKNMSLELSPIKEEHFPELPKIIYPKLPPKLSMKASKTISPSINKLGFETPKILKKLTLEEFFESIGAKKHFDKIISTGKGVKDLSKQSLICSSVRNGNLEFIIPSLGRGEYGEVFALNFPQRDPTKKYVVKKAVSKKIPQCITDEMLYMRADKKGKILFPRGSLICDETISEFLISLLVGNIISSNNFIHTYYFGICDGTNQYTFMERVDTSLDKISQKLTNKEIDSIYIQILHAIATYQTLKIVHGDLHTGNIFLTEYKKEVDYFGYKVENTNIYIPNCPWIVKIGDWGLAVKYSQLCIANKNTLAGFFDRGNPIPLAPNFFSKAYDTAYITVILHMQFPYNELIKNSLAWILKCDISEVKQNIKNSFVIPRYRPKVDELENGNLSHVNPIDILLNPVIMGNYHKEKKGKIELLGEI